MNNPAHSIAVLNCSGNANRPELSRAVPSHAEPYRTVPCSGKASLVSFRLDEKGVSSQSPHSVRHCCWSTDQKVTEQGDINPNHLNNSSLKTFPSQTHSQEQYCNKVEVCDLSSQSICTQRCTSLYMYCLQRMEHSFKNSFLSGLSTACLVSTPLVRGGRRGSSPLGCCGPARLAKSQDIQTFLV